MKRLILLAVISTIISLFLCENVLSKQYTFSPQMKGATFTDKDGGDFTHDSIYQNGIKLLGNNTTVYYTFIIPPATAATNYISFSYFISGKSTGPAVLIHPLI